MRREWNRLFRTILPAGVLGVAAFTITTQTAGGFFPPVPPPVTKVTVEPPPDVPPVTPPIIIPPPPPPFTEPPPPPVLPPPPPPPVVVVPVVVPEPATVTTGLLGLAVVAGWVWKKRRHTGRADGTGPDSIGRDAEPRE